MSDSRLHKSGGGAGGGGVFDEPSAFFRKYAADPAASEAAPVVGAKTSFYVWYLGHLESDGLRGAEFIRPKAKVLASRSESKNAPLLTLQVSAKGVKLVQPQHAARRQFVPHGNITCVHQADDLVSVILISTPGGDEPILGKLPPLSVHAFRCDSSETAECLSDRLLQLVGYTENQEKWEAIEKRLKEQQEGGRKSRCLSHSSSSKMGSDGRSVGRSSDSCSATGSDLGIRSPEASPSKQQQQPAADSAGPSDKIVSLHDSLAAELRMKLKPVGEGKTSAGAMPAQAAPPLLLPPKDYDTVHRSRGKLLQVRPELGRFAKSDDEEDGESNGSSQENRETTNNAPGVLWSDSDDEVPWLVPTAPRKVPAAVHPVSIQTYEERHGKKGGGSGRANKKGSLDGSVLDAGERFVKAGGGNNSDRRKLANGSKVIARRNSFHELHEDRVSRGGSSEPRRAPMRPRSSNEEANMIADFLASKRRQELEEKEAARAASRRERTAREQERDSGVVFEGGMEAVGEFERLWPAPPREKSRDAAGDRSRREYAATRDEFQRYDDRRHQAALGRSLDEGVGAGRGRPGRRRSPERAKPRIAAGEEPPPAASHHRGVLRREKTHTVFDHRYPLGAWPQMAPGPPPPGSSGSGGGGGRPHHARSAERDHYPRRGHSVEMVPGVPPHLMLHHQHPIRQAIIAPMQMPPAMAGVPVPVQGHGHGHDPSCKSHHFKKNKPEKLPDYSRYPGLDILSNKNNKSQASSSSSKAQLQRSPSSYGFSDWHHSAGTAPATQRMGEYHNVAPGRRAAGPPVMAGHHSHHHHQSAAEAAHARMRARRH